MELLTLYLVHKVLNGSYTKGNSFFDYRHKCCKVLFCFVFCFVLFLFCFVLLCFVLFCFFFCWQEPYIFSTRLSRTGCIIQMRFLNANSGDIGFDVLG